MFASLPIKAFVVALSTSTPADTATPTNPPARLSVKVRTALRFDAATATPRKLAIVPTLVVRLVPGDSELSLLFTLSLLPSPLKSIGPSDGVPTEPCDLRLD